MMEIEIREVVQTSWACPSQWDAWDINGDRYYVRYRHGELTVNSGGPGGPLLFEGEYGDFLDGIMEWEEVLRHTGMTMA